MRLSIENWHTRRSFGGLKSIEIMAEAGFDGIDYSFNELNDWDHEMYSSGAFDYAKRLREHADVCGIEFCQAHAPLGFRYGMPMEETNLEFGYLVKCMKFASLLGIPNIVVHGIEPPSYIDIFEANLRFYNALLPYCQEYDIKIAVENLFEFYADGVITKRKFGTPETFSKMLGMLDSRHFVGCVDVGHAKLTGYTPRDFLLAASNSVHCLHFHCNDGSIDSHQLPFMAPFDWDDLIRTLKEIKYDGYFNFELIGFLGKFEKDLLPAALRMAAATGRYLISRMESKEMQT